ncbi:DUF4352 domain-containing protein [Actinopolymorpha pittospori]|uniref:DUF4352 domain-containing protein n=1 Tax=Actinopolymorpha pittospori TaxID=648752 RepID=A0A927MQ36_9ACTN|nr:DUF4352 domain-containing protein [Actinopolymorpha pittospori]MBE1604004.1 hypothetical protein [Actinopolymorpha pittospori]
MSDQTAQPKKKGGCFRLIGIGVVAFVGLIVLIVIVSQLGGGGDDNTSTTEPAASETTAATDGGAPADNRPATTDNKAEEDKGDDKPRTAGLNQPTNDGKFTFTVTKIETGKKQIGTEYLNTKAQGQFVLVHVKVANKSDEPQTFFGDNQYLFDTQNRKASADTEAAIYMGEESQSLFEEINPGNSLSGVIVFDIAADATPDHIELHDSAFSGGVQVSLK